MKTQPHPKPSGAVNEAPHRTKGFKQKDLMGPGWVQTIPMWPCSKNHDFIKGSTGWYTTVELSSPKTNVPSENQWSLVFSNNVMFHQNNIPPMFIMYVFLCYTSNLPLFSWRLCHVFWPSRAIFFPSVEKLGAGGHLIKKPVTSTASWRSTKNCHLRRSGGWHFIQGMRWIQECFLGEKSFDIHLNPI